MGIPLDGDWNDLPAKIESEMTDAGKADWGHPKQAKGGVFAPADMAILKRALEMYKNHLVQTEESERTVSLDLIAVANLMHRINNRT